MVVAASPVTPSAAVSTRVLNIVAHSDDDLLFQNPDLITAIRAGAVVRTVYVTAGDAGSNATYWRSRESGIKAAYAQMAGAANQWTTSAATVAGHAVSVATLGGNADISLIFLRLPDGWWDGTGTARYGRESLQKLYEGDIATMHPVDGAASYTRQQVVDVLGSLIANYQPTMISTLDFQGHYEDGDHSDHYTVAYLVETARQQAAPAVELTGYLGYPIASRPANLSAADSSTKTSIFLTYAPYDANTCATESGCRGRPEGSWLQRQYRIGDTATASPSPTPTPTPTPSPSTSTPTSGAGTNVADRATVIASSQNTDTQQLAIKAVDGAIDGYPGDYTKEWATVSGRTGSWIQLTWTTPVTLNTVVLHDRPNNDDQVTAGTLTFSDGSTIAVPALDNAGGATTIGFGQRTTTSLRLAVDSVSSTTYNVGLAELRALSPSGQ